MSTPPPKVVERRLRALGLHLNVVQGAKGTSSIATPDSAVQTAPTSLTTSALGGLAGLVAAGGVLPATLLSLMALRPQDGSGIARRPPAYAPQVLPGSLRPEFDPYAVPSAPPAALVSGASANHLADQPSAPSAAAVASSRATILGPVSTPLADASVPPTVGASSSTVPVAIAQPIAGAGPAQPVLVPPSSGPLPAEPTSPPVVSGSTVEEAVALGTPSARAIVCSPHEVARPNSTPVTTRVGMQQADELNWVSDGAQVLGAKHFGMLNGLANTLYALYGVEMTVVTLEDIAGPKGQGNRIHQFATDLFNEWGLGDPEVGNGLLVMLVKNKRRLEVVTGSKGHTRMGMRNVLSDQFTADVVAQSMSPQFRQGGYGEGLVFGVERYVEAICRSTAQMKEQHVISKWKLRQPDRERSPVLERLLRERYANRQHNYDSSASRSTFAHRNSGTGRTSTYRYNRSGASRGGSFNREPPPDDTWFKVGAIGTGGAAIGGFAGMGWKRKTACPVCESWGSEGMANISKDTVTEATYTDSGTRAVHNQCRTCGHDQFYTETIPKLRDDSDSSSYSSSSDSSSSSYSSSSDSSSYSSSSYSGGSSDGSGSSSIW